MFKPTRPSRPTHPSHPATAARLGGGATNNNTDVQLHNDQEQLHNQQYFLALEERMLQNQNQHILLGAPTSVFDQNTIGLGSQTTAHSLGGAVPQYSGGNIHPLLNFTPFGDPGTPTATPSRLGGHAPGDTVEEGMGKRMITVEVTRMQSATIRSNKVVIAKPQDLEAEGSALLQSYAERQAGTHNDGALVHTTVSGRLLDATTGALVVEVYPFLVRTSMTATQANMSEWVGAVREELAAGVHPAPCGLYARRVSKGVDAAVSPLSGGDVLSAAKALVGADSSVTATPSPITTLQWSLHVQSTICEAVKIKKEVELKDVKEADQSESNTMKKRDDEVAEAPLSTNEVKRCEGKAQELIAKFFREKGIARRM